ncbi:hypothetical protein QUA70_20995 [Microcoleus sp. LAD1_D5]
MAIQRLATPIPQKAIDKAEAAYQVMEPIDRFSIFKIVLIIGKNAMRF